MGMWTSVKTLLFGRAYEDDYEDETGTEETEAKQTADKSAPKASERTTQSESTDARRSGKVVNLHTMTKLSVVLVKPERYEEVAEIANHLREKRTVVLNLEKANREIARRVLDFLSGVAYTIDGNLKMIASNTYIITPYNVDIQGDLIDELEMSGLYF